MAGQELVTEGFRAGQVGSSAMPHKMNTRSCERVNGLAVVLRGYLSMVGELAGDQWNEGDVSCSVVRRVALPDAFFAIDGLFETFLTVLDDFGAYPAVARRELDRYLPFLATTKVLMAAVRAVSVASRRTRRSGSTRSRSRSRCASQASTATTCSTGSPAMHDWVCLANSSTGSSTTRCRSPERPARRSPPSWRASATSYVVTRWRRDTRPRRSSSPDRRRIGCGTGLQVARWLSVPQKNWG